MPKVETKRDLSPGLPPLERIISQSQATANNSEQQTATATAIKVTDSNNNRTENKTTYDNKQQLGGKNTKVIDINDLAKPSSRTMKRLNALKNNQVKYFEAEAKFHDELHKLQSKYSHVYADIFARRKQIVSGECEPSLDECQWPLTKDESADDKKKENSNASPKSVSSNEMKKDEDSKQKDKDDEEDEEDDEKGVSNFWLEVMLMSQTVSSLIFEQDEPALEYLQDIRLCVCEDKPASSYTLEFEFAENPYFRNRILTKTFEFNNKLDRKHPFKYNGPDLVRTIGCSIDWKPKKNLKVKVIKKKIKSRNRKVPPKIITKEETQASFFRFFDSHEIIRDLRENSEKEVADEKSTEKTRKGEEKEMSVKSNQKSTATNSSSSASSKRGDGSTESSQDSNDSDDNKKSKNKKMSISERNNEIKRMLTETMLTMHDFTVAERFRTKLIPKAVLYMTGEIGESDMSEEEDEDDEDDDDDDDDYKDSDDDHDFYEYDSEEEEDDEDEDDDQGRAWSMHPVTTKLIRSNASNNNSRRGFGPDDCKQS